MDIVIFLLMKHIRVIHSFIRSQSPFLVVWARKNFTFLIHQIARAGLPSYTRRRLLPCRSAVIADRSCEASLPFAPGNTIASRSVSSMSLERTAGHAVPRAWGSASSGLSLSRSRRLWRRFSMTPRRRRLARSKWSCPSGQRNPWS